MLKHQNVSYIVCDFTTLEDGQKEHVCSTSVYFYFWVLLSALKAGNPN